MSNSAEAGINGSNTAEAVRRSLTVIQYWSRPRGFRIPQCHAQSCICIGNSYSSDYWCLL